MKKLKVVTVVGTRPEIIRLSCTLIALDKNDAIEWRNHLDCLNIIPAKNSLLLPRLSELASLDEAHAVFRLPYPPEMGLPNTMFLNE